MTAPVFRRAISILPKLSMPLFPMSKRFPLVASTILLSLALPVSLAAQTLVTELRDEPRTVRELTALSKAGDVEAQLQLGLAYRDGQGVGQDAGQAYR